MFSEPEYLLRTHGDHAVLSDQSSLRDMVTGLRRLAEDLGLDFRSALAVRGRGRPAPDPGGVRPVHLKPAPPRTRASPWRGDPVRPGPPL
jgi:hypothetical protein